MSKPWTLRIAALGLGVLLTLALAEGALRIAAHVVRESRAGEEGASLAVCQGDSFTFGLFLPAESSYPARLEALLREAGMEDARIVNCGIPSKPTWVVKQELRGDLEAYRPRFAFLLAGINDHWRRRPDDDHDVEEAPHEWRVARLGQWIAGRLRGDGTAGDETSAPFVPAARAGEDAASADDTERARARGGNWIRHHEVEHVQQGVRTVRFKDREGNDRSFDILSGEPQEQEFAVWIQEDMARAVAIARAEGSEPFLLGYPAVGRPFDATNDALAATAEATGVSFVDFRPAFQRAAERVGHEALFFPDRHTTALGCDLMARVLLDRLATDGHVDLGDLPPVLAGLPERRTETRLETELVREGGRVTGVRATYETGYGAVLLLSRRPGTTRLWFVNRCCLGLAGTPIAKKLGADVPLGEDPLLVATLEKNEDATHTIGADGSVRLPLPRRKLARWAPEGEPVYGCVVVVLPGVGPIAAVSEVFELELRP